MLALPGGAASPASSSPPGGKGHGYKLGLDTGCLRMTKQPEKLGAGARPLEQSQLRPVFKARGARATGQRAPRARPVSARLVLVNSPCPRAPSATSSRFQGPSLAGLVTAEPYVPGPGLLLCPGNRPAAPYRSLCISSNLCQEHSPPGSLQRPPPSRCHVSLSSAPPPPAASSQGPSHVSPLSAPSLSPPTSLPSVFSVPSPFQSCRAFCRRLVPSLPTHATRTSAL